MTTQKPSSASDCAQLRALIRDREDLWDSLRRAKKPILLWGMGNGGDKVLDCMAEKGLRAAGVFASDGFVRGQMFRGFCVTDYAEAKATFGDFIILLSFATAREEVLSLIDRRAAEQTLLVPDLPVYGSERFDSAFVRAHEEALLAVRTLWEDEASRALYDRVIEAKLSGRYELLMQTVTPDPDGFDTLLTPDSYRVGADLGAYTGDTAARILSVCGQMETLHCLEPDPKTFQRLEKNLHTQSRAILHPYAAWDKEEELTFRVGGSRSSRQGDGGKTAKVKGMPLDAVIGEGRCDYIKFDVEGAEEQAIAGCEGIIRAQRPDMLISLYHRSADLFRIPLLIKRMAPDYRFYLRRAKSIPTWDLNLILTHPKKRP